MAEEQNALIPASTNVETAMDVAAVIASIIPWIGGPVGQVLSGASFGRKLGRIREVLEGVAHGLEALSSQVSEEYVKTEDFEELLEKALKQVAEERTEEKRQAYRRFLTEAIVSPGEPYDEQVRFLRIMEEIQADHIRILWALSQPPNPNPGMMGSPGQTIAERLPDIPRNRINELVTQMNDIRITNMTSMSVMMTGHGAQDLRSSITPVGQRFIRYLTQP